MDSNPGLGGNLEQDLRLIQDGKDVVPMYKLNVGGSRDTIILFVESGHTPLAVEVPDGAGVGAGAATGDDASVGVNEEFDWLNEGLEGEDFADDIFGESSPPHTVPSDPNTVPTTDTSQPTTDTPHPNNNIPQSNTNTPQPNTDTHGRSNVPPPNIDLDKESRKAARGLITGNEEAQYSLLRDYAEMIRRTNVRSKVILQTEMENENAEPKFKRMYIRHNAQKVGFLGGCRSFVGLDGCHLKDRFGGQLLFAIAKDGNNNIFPVAMAVVEQENKDNWTWFLEQFADDIGKPEELNLVFISDRQKGLLPTMKTLFSTVGHRYCVKHIYNNFKVNHKGMELKSVL
ncbi:hypothetical protein SO802_027691 [Lithocarpus litseifolius]|uniref:MULE transposase domain-containing protein n=1 Tax=Lithocarpus litseifolius TaxID=425828 RepID=A0AAW2C3C9_9ROSI